MNRHLISFNTPAPTRQQGLVLDTERPNNSDIADRVVAKREQMRREGSIDRAVESGNTNWLEL